MYVGVLNIEESRKYYVLWYQSGCKSIAELYLAKMKASITMCSKIREIEALSLRPIVKKT